MALKDRTPNQITNKLKTIIGSTAGAEPPVRSPLSQSISGAPHPRDEKIDLANMQLHGLRFILLFDGRINRRLVERRAQRERACWRREGGKKMREESLPGITLMRAPGNCHFELSYPLQRNSMDQVFGKFAGGTLQE
ncbi:hypothetical protein MTP99_009814 [Tenebrio molitor]|nr:hypothetical protein MTP99_009814 [Tenebrio molitor]